jgi:hypothetical protein
MSELSPEERERIFEEEKVKKEAQAKLKQEDAKKMGKGCGIGCLGFIGLIVLVYVIGSFSDSERSTPPGPSIESSMPFKLALIDGNAPGSESDPVIEPYRTALAGLGRKFVETPDQLGDMTVEAQNQLREAGINQSLLSLMQGIESIFVTPIGNQRYAEYMSAYMVLRQDGQNHSQAIVGLNALIDTITG